MSSLQPVITRSCPNCRVATEEDVLGQVEYRCPKCNFEMAHLDTAPNGSIRGVFGYLRSVDEKIQDRYLIQRVLGKGGFGATYLVEDLKLKGKRRALKEVPELLFDEHEVNVLSQLNHPTIPDIIDRFVGDGMVYLILEFGGRNTLGSECQRFGGRLPLQKAIPIMNQLCDALSYLHSQKPPIIHRDLKPDNILLDDNNRIMLIDFGIAKESSQGTTRLMARAASHGFSPPEQVLGTGTDERSDIYSFGATLYYALTGQVPAPAHERVSGTDLVPPSSLVPGLPPELDEMILSTLSLNINQRPAKVDDLKYMLDALSSLVVSDTPNTSQTVRLGPTTGQVTTGQHSTSGTGLTGIRIATSAPVSEKIVEAAPKKKNNIPLLAIAAVVLIGLTIGAYFLFRSKGTDVKPSSPVASPAPGVVPQPVPPPAAGQAAVPLPAPATAVMPPSTSQPPPLGDQRVLTPAVEPAPATPEPGAGQSAEELLKSRRSEQDMAAEPDDKTAGETAPVGKKTPAGRPAGKHGAPPPPRRF